MNKNVNVALQPTQPVDQNPKWLLTEFFVFSPHAHESVCFQSYDSGDSQLDSSELLKFIQHNESVVELQSYADQESNNLLRLVCLQVCMLTKKCGSGRGERAFKYLFFQWYCLCVENLIFVLQHYFKTSHWTWSWPEQTLLQASCGKPHWQKHLHSVWKKRKAAIKMIFTAFALFL